LTRAAFNAGTRHATKAATANVTATSTNVLRIARFDAVEQRGNDASQRESSAETAENPDQRQRHALPDHHADNLTALGAQRQAHTDLLSALRRRKCNHSVNTDH